MVARWGGPRERWRSRGGTPAASRGGGGRMPEGRAGHAHCGHAGPSCGGTAGALDPGATHGSGRWRTVLWLPPGGGQEPGGVPRGVPGGAEHGQRSGGQGDVPVLGTLAAVAMALEPLASDGSALQGEGGMAPESPALDGGAGGVVVEGGGGREESPALLHTAHGGETVGGVGAQEREGVPVAREDVLREDAHATGAETQGRWGKAIDVCAVQEGVLQLLCSDAVGCCVGALRQETSCPDRGFLSPFARAPAGESRKHVLTPWGHELSPFVRSRVVRVTRQTSSRAWMVEGRENLHCRVSGLLEQRLAADCLQPCIFKG